MISSDLDESKDSHFLLSDDTKSTSRSRLGSRSNSIIDLLPDTKRRRSGSSIQSWTSGVASTATVLEHVLPAGFSAHYRMGDYIGKGRFGTVVYSCYHHVSCSEKAVKILKKNHKTLPRQQQQKQEQQQHKLSVMFHTEFQILKNLDHPSILKIHEVFEGHHDSRLYMVMDLCKGGTLKDDIDTWGPSTSEETAALVIMQVLSCINYCHGKGIVHCDLNAENILLEKDKLWDQIKVIDFGLSLDYNNYKNDDSILKEPRGTKFYMAPEVWDPTEKVVPKSDMWSIGILAYFIMSEHFPFEELVLNDEEFYELIREKTCLFEDHMHEDMWIGVSDQAKDFICRLLTWESELRPTAEEALKHPWIEHVREVSSDHIKAKDYGKSAVLVLDNLLQFQGYQNLRQVICTYMATQLLTQEEKKGADELFRAMDTDCNGQISRDEVKMGYIKFYGSRGLTPRQLHTLFLNVDSSRTGFIDYSEFIVASILEKDLLSEKNLFKAFNAFDMDSCGVLSSDSIRKFFQSCKSMGDAVLKHDYDNDEEIFIKSLFDKVAADGEEIHFVEFCNVMRHKEEQQHPVTSTTLDIHRCVNHHEQLRKLRKMQKLSNNDNTKDHHVGLDVAPNDDSETATDENWDTDHTSSTTAAAWKNASLGGNSLHSGGSLRISAKDFVGLRARNITDSYRIDEYVNSGGYGSIYMCAHRQSGREGAVKIVKKSQRSQEENAQILNEINLLKDLDHPNILRLYETFHDDNHYYMVVDVCKGGDLCDQLDAFGPLSEVDASILMNQLLACINYLHKRGVMHRDLKPENIMLEQNMQMSQIKLIDFGLARDVKDESQKFSDRKGTVQYMAPEVLRKSYGKKCDIWSCGMIAYVLMTDDFPYGADTREEKINNIMNGNFDFDHSPIWATLSEEARDFVQHLLNVNEDLRPNAQEALKHPWIEDIHEAYLVHYLQTERGTAMSALNNLKNFTTNNSELRKATYALMSSQLITKQEREVLDELFRVIDIRREGRLSKADIKAGYREYFGEDILSDEEINALFQRVNLSQSGFIEYSEFVMATMNEQDLLFTNNKLEHAFSLMDQDRSGRVSVGNLKQLLTVSIQHSSSTGVPYDDDGDCSETSLDTAIHGIIDEVDRDGDGTMTYEEFMKTMKLSNHDDRYQQEDSCVLQ